MSPIGEIFSIPENVHFPSIKSQRQTPNLQQHGHAHTTQCTTQDLSVRDIKKFWTQMLEAVQVVHDERIVHSDLNLVNF